LEIARAEKKIGSSLEAAPIVFAPSGGDVLSNIDFEEICITSGVTLRDLNHAPNEAFELPNGVVKVLFEPANGDKCDRCWRVLPEVTANATHLCDRCTGALAGLDRVPA
jgi:isoleucyl-tRNA synthetase